MCVVYLSGSNGKGDLRLSYDKISRRPGVGGVLAFCPLEGRGGVG